MRLPLKIGTRESELAVWQATAVQSLLKENNVSSELVYIKSEGDIDVKTPLYEIGVQGIFTRSLDTAMLNDRIDIAVHSMKDVPTLLPAGIRQAAVLKRASYKDLLVFKGELSVVSGELSVVSSELSVVSSELSVVSSENSPLTTHHSQFTVATSSIRRKAQWLHRYPSHKIENLRGNVNTRLRKVYESNWNAAIFAAAGLERINLRPENAVELEWMLPAPAQGAIMVVCREDDQFAFEACQHFNDPDTALCAKIERDFLRELLGGCSTPISALAEIKEDNIIFKGNICSTDGKELITVEKRSNKNEAEDIGRLAAKEILQNTAAEQIIYTIRNAKK